MEKNQITKSLNDIKLVKAMSIFDNIDDIFEKHADYLLAIPFISQLIFFFCMHFLGAMSLAGFINLGFLEKITPDIFIIHTKAEIQVFSYLYGLVVFHGVIVLIYYQIIALLLCIYRFRRFNIDIKKPKKNTEAILGIKPIFMLVCSFIFFFWAIDKLYFDGIPIDDMEELFGLVCGLLAMPIFSISIQIIILSIFIRLKGDY